MRKIVTISAVAASLAVAAIVMPGSAQARFGAGIAADAAMISGSEAQPVYYYYYGYRRPYYYAPRYYAPRYYAPRYYAPRYYRYY
jgi:hypothetical protein